MSTTNPNSIPMTNGTTVIPLAVNPLQQKYDHQSSIRFLHLWTSFLFNRNIRRCINATGRLSNNGNTSPPSLNRTTPTGVLSSSSRPSQSSPNIVHHRGAYYTILRPSSRRTDVGHMNC